jgi:hypothetical protein
MTRPGGTELGWIGEMQSKPPLAPLRQSRLTMPVLMGICPLSVCFVWRMHQDASGSSFLISEREKERVCVVCAGGVEKEEILTYLVDRMKKKRGGRLGITL